MTDCFRPKTVFHERRFYGGEPSLGQTLVRLPHKNMVFSDLFQREILTEEQIGSPGLLESLECKEGSGRD